MFACLDLGGTNIRGTWIDSRGRSGQVDLQPRPRNLEGTKESLISLIGRIQSQAPERLSGIGLATAGPLDHRRKTYLRTSNMPELDHFRVGAFLEEAFSLPVLMENDAQAAALGEVWAGGLAGRTEAVVLTLGTGVGSGVIMGGTIWRANHFTGPELGHIHLGFGRPRCGCGQEGCAETWLNKQALMDLFQEQGHAVTELREMLPLVRQGDEGAAAAMRHYGERAGLYFSILQVTFGMRAIGLSGGLSSFIPYCEASIWETLKSRFEHRPWWLPETIAVSPDPEMSALKGMARAFVLQPAQAADRGFENGGSRNLQGKTRQG